MEFEFPYDRVGEPSNAGRTQAKFLRDQPGDYLQKEGEDGVWAYKQGEFLNVENDAQATDGFYSLGNEGDGIVIRGSSTARGNFALRGGGPFGGLTVPQILNFGGGRGMLVNDLGEIGGVIDEWGLTCSVFRSAWYLTRDGRTVTERGHFDRAQINTIAGSVGGGAQFVQGARHDGVYETGWAFDTVDEDGVHYIRFGRDNGTDITYTTIWREQGYFPTIRGLARVGPKAYLALIALAQPEGLLDGYDGVYDVAIESASFFMYSNDAGDTWSRIDPELTALEMATFDTIKANLGYRNVYNAAARWSSMEAIPLTGTTALVYMLSPLIQNSSTLITDDVARGNVTYGVLTAPDGISKSGVLYQAIQGGETGGPTTLDNAWRFVERFAVQAPGGGALVMYNTTVDLDYSNVPFKILHTTDGVTLTPIADSPALTRRMGQPLAVSDTQLFCPIYDGTRSLYESRDLGASWTKHAILSPLTTDPPSLTTSSTRSVPQDFGVLAYLRRQGLAANTNPGAPWVGDDRIAPP